MRNLATVLSVAGTETNIRLSQNVVNCLHWDVRDFLVLSRHADEMAFEMPMSNSSRMLSATHKR